MHPRSLSIHNLQSKKIYIVAMKPNAPNPLNQFDRATVNRPLMRARLGARRGANCGPTISMITVLALVTSLII